MNLSVNITAPEIPSPDTDSTKLFVFVGGTSESGKSAFSKLAYAEGHANRVKYLRIANELGLQLHGNDDPYAFLDESDPLRAQENQEYFWRRLDALVEGLPRVTVIETIKHPGLLQSFGRAALDAKLLTVFIDADFELRVQRESERLGVAPEALVAAIQQKDALKERIGLQGVRAFASVHVENNGTYAEYTDWARNFLAELRARFPGSQTALPLLYE